MAAYGHPYQTPKLLAENLVRDGAHGEHDDLKLQGHYNDFCDLHGISPEQALEAEYTNEELIEMREGVSAAFHAAGQQAHLTAINAFHAANPDIAPAATDGSEPSRSQAIALAAHQAQGLKTKSHARGMHSFESFFGMAPKPAARYTEGELKAAARDNGIRKLHERIGLSVSITVEGGHLKRAMG